MILPGRKSVSVFAPASVSNLGPGFDILGFPVYGLGDQVKVTVNHDTVVRITKIEGTDKLPYDIDKNTAGRSVSNFLAAINAGFGVNIEIKKGLPLGSGLGSSAASSVAAVYAANMLLEEPLEKSRLLEFALDGEEVAAGSRHGDNVIPSLFGGLILVYDPQNHRFYNLPFPENLICLLIHPSVEINTSYARSILDPMVPLKSVITQTGNLAKLIFGMSTKNIEVLRGAFEDQIAEPKRSHLIPEYRRVKHIAMEGGALGCNISGSGPSIFALYENEQLAQVSSDEILKVYSEKGIFATSHISRINQNGAELLSWE